LILIFRTVIHRYAATHLAINAFTFNRNLSTYYILLYDLVSILNFKAT